MLLLHSARLHSPNDLEASLLPAGYLHVRYGRFDCARVNTPLSRMACALPLLCGFDVREEWGNLYSWAGARPEYPLATDFLRENLEVVGEMFFAGRVVATLFSVVGAWSVYQIAWRVYGRHAALAAVVAWCFYPMVLGHGATVNHDVPGAAMAALCCLACLRLADSQHPAEAFLCGFASGLALLTRTTSAILIALWLVLFVGASISRGKCRSFARRVGLSAIVAGVTLFMLNLGYEFSGSMTRLGDYEFVSSAFTGTPPADGDPDAPMFPGNRFDGTILAAVPLPLPRDFVLGIDLQQRDFESPEFKSYLCGEWRERGWWYYYLVGWVVKTPIGFQLLFLAATVSFLRELLRGNARRYEGWIIAAIVVVFGVASLKSGFTIHYRYVLPALPFLAIFSARLWRDGAGNRLTHWGSGILLGYGVLSSLAVHPHSLSYFNEFAGGPENGGRYLLHSSIDWGQDIYLLNDWYQRRGSDGPPVYHRCYGPVARYSLEVPHNPIPPRRSPTFRRRDDEEEIKPGTYVISVMVLYAEESPYRYLDSFEPVEHIGYSVKVYELAPGDILRLSLNENLSRQPSG